MTVSHRLTSRMNTDRPINGLSASSSLARLASSDEANSTMLRTSQCGSTFERPTHPQPLDCPAGVTRISEKTTSPAMRPDPSTNARQSMSDPVQNSTPNPSSHNARPILTTPTPAPRFEIEIGRCRCGGCVGCEWRRRCDEREVHVGADRLQGRPSSLQADQANPAPPTPAPWRRPHRDVRSWLHA